MGVSRSALGKAARTVLLVAGVAIATTATPLNAQVAGEVRGRVTNAETARPITNSRVEVTGRSELVRTDVDGNFVLRGLPPGNYVVTVRAVGYAGLTRDIEIRNGRVTPLAIALVAQVVVLSDVRVRAALDSTALNTTVLNRTIIERSGQRDLGELLQTTPGVVVTPAGGPGQSSRVSIRGSSANQVLVLIDGVPFNSTISGSADLSRISLETVESITVRTGAQSARYGPRALAGVIEIETRKPRQEISTFLKTGALGEYNASAMAGNTTSIGNARVGAFAGGEYRTVAGDFAYTLPAFRGGGRATRINSDATTTQVIGGLSIDGASASASLRGTWEDTERGLAGTIIQPSGTGRQGDLRRSVSAGANGNVRRVAWTFAGDITHEAATFIDHSPPFGQMFDDTISATGITASGSASIGQGVTSGSVGADLRTLDVTSTMLSRSAPHWQQLLGAWGNARFTHAIAADVRIDAELSGRVDRSSLSKAAVFSPRGTVRISRGVISTSVSLGSGYAPPTLSDQFFHEGVQVRANPRLRSERTRNDLEGRASVRETRVSIFTVASEIAAYRSNIDGMILWFPDFQFIWSPTNFDVKRSGWEWSGKLGVPASKFELAGTLNRNDVTYTGAILHGQVAYRPRQSANVTASFAPKPLRVDVTNRYIGTRRTVAGSALNALTPYWMSDVRASTTLTSHRLTFNPAVGVENVFNRAAAMLVDYPFPPRTWSISLRVRHATIQSP